MLQLLKVGSLDRSRFFVTYIVHVDQRVALIWIVEQRVVRRDESFALKRVIKYKKSRNSRNIFFCDQAEKKFHNISNSMQACYIPISTNCGLMFIDILKLLIHLFNNEYLCKLRILDFSCSRLIECRRL
jgi:hypothetical protein